MSFKQLTLPLRHKIVKLIAPHVFEYRNILEELVDATPRPFTLVAEATFRNQTSLVGAEIGVYKGLNALSILETLPVKTLYLIDPYVPYSGSVITAKMIREAYYIAHKRLSGFKQAYWIRESSDAACSKLPMLDFVYIDGDHSYSQVKRDITNYYPLVKNNGLIGGHDYTTLLGLVKACNEFAHEHNITLNTVFPDWWIIK